MVQIFCANRFCKRYFSSRRCGIFLAMIFAQRHDVFLPPSGKEILAIQAEYLCFVEFHRRNILFLLIGHKHVTPNQKKQNIPIKLVYLFSFILNDKNIRYTITRHKTDNAPFWLPPNSDVAEVITGGTMAPPTIPVIIRPEISLALSGRRRIAIEKITENMLEHV